MLNRPPDIADLRGQIENLRNIVIAQFLIPSEDQRHPLRLGQLRDRLLDGALQFVLQERSVRRGGDFVGQGDFFTFRIGLKRHLRASLRSAQLVEDQVAGDL